MLLQVRFVDESAIDEGGPRREFFLLFAREASKTYFCGSEAKFLMNNITAVQVSHDSYVTVYEINCYMHRKRTSTILVCIL